MNYLRKLQNHNKTKQNKTVAVSKFRNNIYSSDIRQFTFEIYSHFDVYRSFIQNKPTFTKYCLTQWVSKHRELWNPLSKAVPGKFHGPSGHNKRNCLQDRANIHRPLVWHIVLIFYTAVVYVYSMVYILRSITAPDSTFWIVVVFWTNTVWKLKNSIHCGPNSHKINYYYCYSFHEIVPYIT